jgi:CRP-like cAMP-binding protein
MEKITCVAGENVIMEGEEGSKIFFIESGKLCVLHRESHTYLEDLFVNSQFISCI